ncbi:hypothetical protein SAMN05421823_107132 [Catalinimonas alkaloidigena]|uniref:Uncharacterized protein n=1 Tax=Catalinimonas alkaloidigena TaxID=1075417 RepID=A0A1G9LQ96_9BACT|nr:hypothetical protein [Catalinimonas alkaloidigena]SDL64098.1 hypothetical protein SAMN05421823_107132 [Catalinimonas alkaloidigena]
MKSLFRSLYELIAGNPQPPADTPLYRDIIFPDVGGVTLLITLGLVLVYYYGLNHFLRIHWFSLWYHWLLVLMLNAVIAYIYATYYCNLNEATPDSYIYWFGTANALWSAVFFLAFSFAVKWKSSMASRTPF